MDLGMRGVCWRSAATGPTIWLAWQQQAGRDPGWWVGRGGAPPAAAWRLPQGGSTPSRRNGCAIKQVNQQIAVYLATHLCAGHEHRGGHFRVTTADDKARQLRDAAGMEWIGCMPYVIGMSYVTSMSRLISHIIDRYTYVCVCESVCACAMRTGDAQHSAIMGVGRWAGSGNTATARGTLLGDLMNQTA